MARSLPVSVPFPEGLPKRGEIFDIPSEEDEEEIFFEGPQGTLQNKLFEIIELIHYNSVDAYTNNPNILLFRFINKE